MLTTVLPSLRRAARRLVAAVHKRLSSGTKPAPLAVAAGMATDVARSRHELVLENALLRQQVLILHRRAKRPLCWLLGSSAPFLGTFNAMVRAC